MKRVMKWLGIAVAGLATIVIVVLALVYAISSRRMGKVAAFSTSPLVIPTDSASIASGRHFVQAIGKCASCHGDDLAGRVVVDDPIMGRIYSSNLTRGKGGIGGAYTDSDYVRAIRHGAGKDDHPLVVMPTDAFYYVNDRDLANTIAYLKTIPAVDAVLPARRVGPLARALYLTTDFPLVPSQKVDQTRARPPVVSAAPTREYGDYLATTGGCKGCHLQDLSGGVPIQKNLLSSNLTPSGIGKWTETDFGKALRDGIRPDGRILSAVMPWPYTRFMTDDEIHALWLYVHSVPPKNARGR